MTKQLITIGAAIMTTLLGLVMVWQFRIVVVYILISLTLAAAVRPLVKRLPRRGFLRAWPGSYCTCLCWDVSLFYFFND